MAAEPGSAVGVALWVASALALGLALGEDGAEPVGAAALVATGAMTDRRRR